MDDDGDGDGDGGGGGYSVSGRASDDLAQIDVFCRLQRALMNN